MCNAKAPCVGCGECDCRLYKRVDPATKQTVRMCLECKAMVDDMSIMKARTVGAFRFNGRLFTPGSFLDTFVGG